MMEDSRMYSSLKILPKTSEIAVKEVMNTKFLCNSSE